MLINLTLLIVFACFLPLSSARKTTKIHCWMDSLSFTFIFIYSILTNNQWFYGKRGRVKSFITSDNRYPLFIYQNDGKEKEIHGSNFCLSLSLFIVSSCWFHLFFHIAVRWNVCYTHCMDLSHKHIQLNAWMNRGIPFMWKSGEKTCMVSYQVVW